MSKENFKTLFDKIYVVSLPKDIERRKSIADQLDIYGLKPTFVDGVIMESISDNSFLHVDFWKDKDKDKDKDKFVDYRKKVCGTYLAHLNALERVLDFSEGKSFYGMILEDDIILKPNFTDRVLELIDGLEKEEKWLCCSLQKRLYKELCEESSNSLYYRGTTLGHQGYIYNRVGQRNLLEKFYSVLRWACNEEIDMFYTRLVHHFPIFGTSIPIVAQGDFESNISNDKGYINKV